MKIGIDIDNVLADLNEQLHLWHKKNYDFSRPLHERTKFGLDFQWNCSEEEGIKRLFEFFETEDFKKVLPVKGAIEAINKLAKEHELHAITARSPIAEKETLRWMHEHFSFDNFKKIHINGHSNGKEFIKTKGETCKELGIKLMIEDALPYAEECAEKGVKVLLLDWPWNQTDNLHPNITRVKSWESILKYINSAKSL